MLRKNSGRPKTSESQRPSICRTNPVGADQLDAWIDEFATSPGADRELDAFFDNICGWARDVFHVNREVTPSTPKRNGSVTTDQSSGFGLSIVDQMESNTSEREGSPTPKGHNQIIRTIDTDENDSIRESQNATPRLSGQDTRQMELKSPLRPLNLSISSSSHCFPLSVKQHNQLETESSNDPTEAVINSRPQRVSNQSSSNISPTSSNTVGKERALPPLPMKPFPLGPGFAPPPTPNSYIHPMSPLLRDFPSPPHGAYPFKATPSSRLATQCPNSYCEKEVYKLQTQLEMAERQNRLLEAALQAVLWTAGSINGCPCAASGMDTGRDHLGIGRPPSMHTSHQTGEFGSYGPLKAQTEERRPSATSICSGKSNISALDLYKETRF
jgi:hypothetical protein